MGKKGAGVVDPSARYDAISAARASGKPQPLKDEAGNVLYFVDGAGNELADPNAAPAPAPSRAPAAGSGPRNDPTVEYDKHLQSVLDQTSNQWMSDQGFPNPQRAQQQQAASKQQQDDHSRGNEAFKETQTEAQLGAPVWVNGQMRVVTGYHSDGTPIFGYLGSSTGKAPDEAIDPNTGKPFTAGGPSSAFDALHLGASYGPMAGIQGSDMFVMANGPTDVNTGLPASQQTYGAPGTDHSYKANVVSQGQTQMTIAEGVQWLVKLANQNKAAYDQLVTELRHAGYTGAQGEPLTGGTYSETVGVAFAKAAKDLSVQQQTSGSSMGLDEFLQRRQDAVRQAAEQATPLVQRNYTDPGTLQAQARSAAENALGRTLTADELARFQQSFHGQEDSYYNQVDAYNKAKAGAGAIGDNAGTAGFTATQPDSSGQAAALVQSPEYGQERANYAAGNYYQAIAQMFGIK